MERLGTLFKLRRTADDQLQQLLQQLRRKLITATVKAGSHIACRAHAVPLPCRVAKGMCLSRLIYTVRPCLIHTCHDAPMPCSDHAVLLKATAQHGRRETACGLPARVRLLPAITRSSTKLLSEAYQSSSQRSIPTTVKSDSSMLQKGRSVKMD